MTYTPGSLRTMILTLLSRAKPRGKILGKGLPMIISNEKDIPTEHIAAHGGAGIMKIKFAFKDYQHSGNNNDSQWNCFAVAELPVGVATGYHRHVDTDEFFYIIDGEATITVDGEARQIKKGDIILTRKGSSHGITNVKRKLRFTVTEIFR